MVSEINCSELKQVIKSGEKLVILDVRNDYEHFAHKIPGSILIPLHELANRVLELSQYKDSKVIVYCKAGIRSAAACKFLATQGFTDLVNLVDGASAWHND